MESSLARDEVRDIGAERVIVDYVAAARHGTITPGEKALIVSLNLRWWPDVLSIRQAAGLEPIRYRLGEVQQEPLAQGASPNTYHVDAQRQLWKVIDRASSPATLSLTTFSGDRLPPGRYTINGAQTISTVDGIITVPRSSVVDTIVIEPAPNATPLHRAPQ